VVACINLTYASYLAVFDGWIFTSSNALIFPGDVFHYCAASYASSTAHSYMVAFLMLLAYMRLSEANSKGWVSTGLFAAFLLSSAFLNAFCCFEKLGTSFALKLSDTEYWTG